MTNDEIEKQDSLEFVIREFVILMVPLGSRHLHHAAVLEYIGGRSHVSRIERPEFSIAS
jgi:hypothetical protein